MPTYEYVCEACGHAWEAFQSIKDSPLKKCPECGKARAKRQVSAGSGFILKGGGWYSDLYGSAKQDAKEPAGEVSTKAESSSNGAAKADKPDAGTSDTAKKKPKKDKGGKSGAASSD
jgi:putative FmdB family regulatory protein